MQKLQLTWIGKDKYSVLEPRILQKNNEYQSVILCEKSIKDNMLIHGDNLLSLKALETNYSQKVKCIFIDPPYNTGSAFEHYDDGVEHSIWLNLMRDRLLILRSLLSEDGSLWISIDDNEVHYLKVLCDEIFGRNNFVANVVWQKKYTISNDAKWLSDTHDHVLVYAKNKVVWRPNKLPRTAEMNARYKNPDNHPKGPWKATPLHAKSGSASNKNFSYTFKNGVVWTPPAGTYPRFSNDTLAELDQGDAIWFGKDGKSAPSRKTFLSELKDEGTPCPTVWLHNEAGHNHEAREEVKQFNPNSPFSTPKPERLLQRIIHLATDPGDLVLDSFAGSGTTGAVAHKMGRRWIMIELGEHCYTHIIPRLKKVIDGEDEGGVTESTGWQGGGGFRYYKLAPSLMKKDQWDNWVINPEYNQEMLVEAMCKLEGYTYAPSETEYWNHGKGSETDFIYVTTQTLTDQQLQAISEEVGEGRTLLIIASAWRSKNIDRFINLTLKKIPNSIIKACEWGHDDYSLNVQNLPMSEPDIEEKPKAKKVKNTQEQSQVTGDLFGDQT